MSYTFEHDQTGELIADSIVSTERIRLPTYSSAPSIHTEGSLYYNTTENDMYQSDGSVWSSLTANKLARHITLAQSGGDYTDLNSAITAASALTPTPTSPVQIQVYPGTYTFTNPISVPSNVLITSLADSANNLVTLNGTNVASTGLNMLNESSLDGVRILNCSPAINCSSGTVRISNCVCLDNISGVQVETGAICVAKSCTVMSISGFVITGFQCVTGGKLFGTDLYCRNMGGVANTGYRCDGLGSIMFLDNCNSIGCDIGSVTSNNGVINYNTGRTLNSTNVAHSVVGGTLNMIGHENSGTGDHLDIDSTGIAYIQATKIRFDKIIRAAGSIINGNYFSETPGDTGMRIEGELSVGNIFNPTESVFGAGDSYTTGMRCFHGTATGPGDDGSGFVDITSDLLLPDGNTVNAFPALTTNSTLYIFSEHAAFPGIKITVTTASTTTTPIGVVEYWDGSTWVSTTIMSTQSNPPYLPLANNRFNSAGSFQYRVNIENGMAIKTLNSVTGYWMRFRLNAPLVGMPVLDQIKLHSNRMEINRDGFVELFGEAQLENVYPYDINIAKPANQSPFNQDYFVDDNLSVGMTENNFEAAGTDKLGILFNLPSNTDTSRGLKFYLKYFVSDATAGNFELQIRAARWVPFVDDSGPLSDVFTSTAGAPANAPGLISNTIYTVPIVAATNNKLLSYEFEVDISSLILRRLSGSNTGDSLMFSISRLGSTAGDTFAGSVYFISLTPVYISWSNGTPRVL